MGVALLIANPRIDRFRFTIVAMDHVADDTSKRTSREGHERRVKFLDDIPSDLTPNRDKKLTCLISKPIDSLHPHVSQ